jgi:hypothetical protein
MVQGKDTYIGSGLVRTTSSKEHIDQILGHLGRGHIVMASFHGWMKRVCLFEDTSFHDKTAGLLFFLKVFAPRMIDVVIICTL